MDTSGGNAIVDVLVFEICVVACVIAVVAVVVATTTTCTDVPLMCTYICISPDVYMYAYMYMGT